MKSAKTRARLHLHRMRQINPDYTGRPDNSDLRIHLKHLNTYLSIAEIARRAGVAESTAWEHAHGRGDHTALKASFLDTRRKLLGVHLQAADVEGFTTPWERIVGAYRIVQGLAALGWTAELVAMETGSTLWVIRSLSRTPRRAYVGQCGKDTYERLLSAAQRLEVRDPEGDPRQTVRSSRVVRGRCRARAVPPLGVWDLDTIHLASSRPDWTGECGTVTGYQLHRRRKLALDAEGAVTCEPCLTAKRETTGDAKATALTARNAAILRDLADGMTSVEVAEEHGVSWRTIHRIRKGQT